MSNTFPKTLAALRVGESSQWAIGDALLEECGPPGDDTTNNGSGKLLAAASAYVKANGLDYAENTLRTFRDISHLYPHARRVASVGWSVHRAVPSPDMLNRLIVEAKSENQALTVVLAQTMVQRIYDENDRRIRAEREAAQAAAAATELAAKKRQQDAARAAKTATSAKARQQAEQAQATAAREAQEARQQKIANQKMPTRTEIQAVPAELQIPGIALSSVLLSKAGQALILARETQKIIDARGDELAQTTVDAVVEKALEAHQAWLNIANSVRKSRTNKRGHLAVVGG